MLSQESRNAVYELLKNPVVGHIQASESDSNGDICFHLKEGHLPGEISYLVREIFPNLSLGTYEVEPFEERHCEINEIRFERKNGLAISIRGYIPIKKEAPQQEGAAQENIQVDYTLIDEIVAREA